MMVLNVSRVSVPPGCIASLALMARLRTIISIWFGSTKAGQRSGANVVLSCIGPPRVTLSRSPIATSLLFRSTWRAQAAVAAKRQGVVQ